MRTNYYISVSTNYYTLRARLEQQGMGGAVYHSDRHVRNLAVDRAQAEAKALELTGIALKAPLTETVDIGERRPVDITLMMFGKYKGVPVSEVDEDYLFYILKNNYVPQSAARQFHLLEARVKDRLEREALKEAAAQRCIDDRNERVIEAVGREWLEYHAKVSYGFLGDVSNILLEGHHALTERQAEVLVDLRAKSEGRRGSKRYEAKYEELQGILGAA